MNNSKHTTKKLVDQKLGLVLTAGGARAAYQAGVLKGISDILRPNVEVSPYKILTGISAGAINVAYLATYAERFHHAADECFRLWKELKPESILKVDFLTNGRLSAKWFRDLSMGELYTGKRMSYLLDTTPLREMAVKYLNFESIKKNIANGTLHGLGFSATNYKTGTAVTFYDGHPSIKQWARTSRIGRRVDLNHAHVLSSASIPVLFEPVQIENCFYGDGAIRLRAPISPAIHLGSDRIMAIGIRYFRPEDMTIELNETSEMPDVTVADITGVLLNSTFMDSLESDLERLQRINITLRLIPEEQRKKHPQQLRELPILFIRPSQDLGRLAAHQFHHLPRMLRHLLKGIGASDERGWDLLSYLSFDSSYTLPLLELGYSDAISRRSEIEAFFFDEKVSF